MIGIPRSHKLREIYSKEYLDFFKNVNIGMQFESKPRKTVFFTNHRSLKEAKTKPFKTELVENPSYVIFIDAKGKLYKEISDVIEKNEFVYPPYLGHAYCPAQISDFKQISVKIINDVETLKTKCVVLDESDEYAQSDDFRPDTPIHAIVERHLHHFFDEDDKLNARVLKHWIPINNEDMRIRKKTKNKLTKFYTVGEDVVCTY